MDNKFYSLINKDPFKYVSYFTLNKSSLKQHVYIDKNLNKVVLIKHTFHGAPLPDISSLSELRKLFCYDNNINNLNLNKNLNLEIVNCSDNNLVYIDVSKNLKLRLLNVDGNPIDNIDLSSNYNLEDLFIARTKIKKVDLLKNINIKKVFANQECKIITNKKYISHEVVITGGELKGQKFNEIIFD